MDLADMQQFAKENLGVKYPVVAIDTLSRFLCGAGVESEDI